MSISGEDSSQVSHPPHLTSSWSSALIPFCAFKTNLSIGDNSFALPGINFPLCSSFLPTIHEGQLCYKLTLNKTSGQGKENELLLLIDFNEDRSLQTSSKRAKLSSHQIRRSALQQRLKASKEDWQRSRSTRCLLTLVSAEEST